MTFSAVATSKKIADRISNSQSGVMMHGPTFMGNPLACATAIASTKLLLESPWKQRIQELESIMTEELSVARNWESVEEVRVLGGIGVVQLKENVDLAEFQKLCIEEGVWIRPFGKNAYIMPPYLAVSDEDVRYLSRSLLKIIEKMYGK